MDQCSASVTVVCYSFFSFGFTRCLIQSCRNLCKKMQCGGVCRRWNLRVLVVDCIQSWAGDIIPATVPAGTKVLRSNCTHCAIVSHSTLNECILFGHINMHQCITFSILYRMLWTHDINLKLSENLAKCRLRNSNSIATTIRRWFSHASRVTQECQKSRYRRRCDIRLELHNLAQCI